MRYIIFIFTFMLVSSAVMRSEAKIVTRTVEYKQGDTVLEGFVAYDDGKKGKRPGILVVHEWWGLNQFIKDRAVALAKLGYVAFAPDIYGKGVRPATMEEAGKTAKIYKSDRTLLRARVKAGLDELRKLKLVDVKKLAATGYCFGGTTVLELARSGADIAGVVSFHGGLDSPNPQDGKNIKARVLVLHGAVDPFNAPADVAAFQDEMNKGNVDWHMVYYGNAVHGFTNSNNGTDNAKGLAYNASADKRSWAAMKLFFKEIFK